MRFIGIDLSWKTEKNPSAVAVGRMADGTLNVEFVEPALRDIDSVFRLVHSQTEVIGIAVDAPLIIENHAGQRPCETALGQDYGKQKASCHTSNRSLYPNSLSVRLSSQLQRIGFQHLEGTRWQIECYPHPAIIECFALSERLAYKRGKVFEKKRGQQELAKLIRCLEYSDVLPLNVPDNLNSSLSNSEINILKGNELKRNEDALDSIICLYIAGLYHLKVASKLYGNSNQGYIWVPQVRCI